MESQLSMEGKESQEIRGREVGVRAVIKRKINLLFKEPVRFCFNCEANTPSSCRFIVFNRLKQLETIGHDTSKVDLIIMGGTFTARTRE